MKKTLLAILFVCVGTAGISMAEMEPNNTKDQASQLTSKVPVIGNIMSEEDQDWFYIETAKPENIFFSFERQQVTPYYQFKVWIVSMYDDQNNMLANKDVFSQETSTFLGTGVSGAGKYYILVVPAARSSNSTYARLYDKNYQNQYTLTVTIGEDTSDPIYTQTELETEYQKGYAEGKKECSGALYTQTDMDNMVRTILTWGDINNDGKIGLNEAIRALQIVADIQ